MQISKWYFDLVTEQGDALVGYHLWAKLGPFRLRCASVDGFVQGVCIRDAAFSLRDQTLPAPRWHAGKVLWTVSAPEVCLLAKPRQQAKALELFESKSGRIEWWPLAPTASVRLRLRGQEFVGTGYVERLNVRMRLTRLPLRTLWWGRWIGESGGSLVCDQFPRRAVAFGAR